MPSKPAFARIAITLPKSTLTAADALARRHDRSRSWIIAEAIRRFAGRPNVSQIAGDVEAADATWTERRDLDGDGLGASRRAQLVRDLQLTPEARVRAAEATLRVTELTRAARPPRIIAFDRYEDYLEWQRLAALRP